MKLLKNKDSLVTSSCLTNVLICRSRAQVLSTQSLCFWPMIWWIPHSPSREKMNYSPPWHFHSLRQTQFWRKRTRHFSFSLNGVVIDYGAGEKLPHMHLQWWTTTLLRLMTDSTWRLILSQGSIIDGGSCVSISTRGRKENDLTSPQTRRWRNKTEILCVGINAPKQRRGLVRLITWKKTLSSLTILARIAASPTITKLRTNVRTSVPSELFIVR